MRAWRGVIFAVLALLIGACGATGNAPANAVEISVLYAPESEQFMPQIMESFNQAYREGRNPVTGQSLADGERPIYITGSPPQGGLSSGGAMQGIVNAAIGANVENQLRPTLFAPSVSHWLSLANLNSGRQLFNVAEAQATAISPIVIAIWESRLRAIQETIGSEEVGWQDLLDVLNSPNGWEDYGIPNGRRSVYFGHSDPRNSSTSLSGLIAEYYACARENGFTGRRLEIAQVRDETVQACVRNIETLVKHYARRTEDFLEYVGQGPEYLDFLVMEEGDVICLNTNGRQGDEACNKPSERLIALYPKEGTFYHEHPIAVVNADWVTPEQRAAAQVFIDYLLQPAQQQIVMSFGFRPANPDVPLTYPFVPENGVQVEGPSLVIDVPEPEVLIALQESWSLVRKKADIILLVDTSGSMQQDNRIGQARDAALAFLENMELNNRVGLYEFNTEIDREVDLNNLENNLTRLRGTISSLRADGGTELYQALTEVVTELTALEDEDRIRAVVLLSDGEDTGDQGYTLQDALNAIAASSETRNPVIVVPVAYGADADIESLQSIARASRTRVVFGDPENILEVLQVISAYF